MSSDDGKTWDEPPLTVKTVFNSEQTQVEGRKDVCNLKLKISDKKDNEIKDSYFICTKTN
jgi:hypothetical protein